jgi:hypothetical protein
MRTRAGRGRVQRARLVSCLLREKLQAHDSEKHAPRATGAQAAVLFGHAQPQPEHSLRGRACGHGGLTAHRPAPLGAGTRWKTMCAGRVQVCEEGGGGHETGRSGMGKVRIWRGGWWTWRTMGRQHCRCAVRSRRQRKATQVQRCRRGRTVLNTAREDGERGTRQPTQLRAGTQTCGGHRSPRARRHPLSLCGGGEVFREGCTV